MAEFEKNVLVMKLRAARERVRKRQGRCEGRKPCGAHPNEQVVLQRMRQLRRKAPKGRRLSLTNVAAALNADGHRNRSGREVVTADGVSRPHELTSQERHRHGRVVTSVVEPKKEGHSHRRSEGAMVEETSSRSGTGQITDNVPIHRAVDRIWSRVLDVFKWSQFTRPFAVL